MESYRDELRKFVRSAESGMIIKADEDYERKHPVHTSNGRAAFKLQSGPVVKEFVTIWELFDHRSKFNDCIVKLAEKAAEVRERLPFSMLVSWTQTTRELVHHVYPLLKTKGDIRIAHFGDYPITPMAEQDTAHFLDEKVLILTDVISSGASVRNMGEIIHKQGGEVVAALAVIVTNPDWIREERETGRAYRLKLTFGGFRVHSLTDLAIEPLEEKDYDKDKLISIDYVSILPKEPIVHPSNYLPKFTLAESLEHLESAEALEFGFFNFGDKYHSYAFNLPRLLERKGEEIWLKIRAPILEAASCEASPAAGAAGAPGPAGTGPLCLVTTYRKNDLHFRDFVQDHLRREGLDTTSIVTLKRGIKDTPYLYLTLGEKRRELQGTTVVLVVATLTTSEKLRSIVSLLVSCHVRKLVVVCLANEMGLYTTSFISAIKQLTQRVTTTEGAQAQDGDFFTGFEFQMVYSFLDLPSDDLGKMQQRVAWLLSQFEAQTKVDSFRRLTGRLHGYFQPRMQLAESASPPSYPRLDQSFSLSVIEPPEGQVAATRHEGKIVLLAHRLALSYDFAPVLEELLATRDRHTFIQLYGLILSEADYLHFNGSLRHLKPRILKRIRDLREERFSIERAQGIEGLELSRIESALNAEAYLLFGLGIIAHYEPSDCFEDVSASELLFCGCSPDEWIALPQNLRLYFSDERVFFMIAFLLRGRFPAFSKASVAREVKKDLQEAIEAFKERLKPLVELDALGQDKASLSLVQNNLDLVLTEIGAHEHQEKHQIIRYLHRQVLRPREGHNPILTSTSYLIQALRSFLEEARPPSDIDRVPVTDRVLAAVDGALSATASLNLVAQGARQLFFFTPSLPESQARYTKPVTQDGFAAQGQELIDRIADIRRRRSMSREDLHKLEELDGGIRADFFDSALRTALEEYIVPLDGVLLRALEEADDRLNKEGFRDLLSSEHQRVSRERDRGHWSTPVLGNKHLLLETLRNVLYNLRHSFPEEHRGSVSADAVRMICRLDRFVLRPDNLPQDGVVLEMHVLGGRSPRKEDLRRRENTIADQLAKLEEFGSQWEVNEMTGGSGFLLRLFFISRLGFAERTYEHLREAR